MRGKPLGATPLRFQARNAQKRKKAGKLGFILRLAAKQRPLPAHLQGRKLPCQIALRAFAPAGGIHRVHHRGKKRRLPQAAEIFRFGFFCHLCDHSAFTSSL